MARVAEQIGFAKVHWVTEFRPDTTYDRLSVRASIMVVITARSEGYLDDGNEREQKFELRVCPPLDLIRFDNSLIRMSTMLAREGHSITSLVEHTHFRGRKVIAFMNACQQLGLLHRISSG
jgi:hypothetical protein